MNKICTLAVFTLLIFSASAQNSPSKFNYQAVVRNNAGQPLANAAVQIRISLHDVTANGTVVYLETHSATTTALGLVNLMVGNGTVVSGTYPTASQWGASSKFLQIEIDPAGGSTYTDLGTTQIVSVPYANFATGADKANSANISTTSLSADTITGDVNPSQIDGAGASVGQVLKWNGTNWIPDVDNSGGSGGGDNWGTQTVVTNTSLSGNGTAATPLRIAQQGATTGQILAWDGAKWMPISRFVANAGKGVVMSGDTLNTQWTASGNNIYNNNSGNVGIANPTPSFPLDVNGNVKISGNLGLNNTSPDAAFVLKTSGGGARDFYFETSGSTASAGGYFKSTGGVTDFLHLRKYGPSAGGTFADGTPNANTSLVVAGQSAGRAVFGTLSSSNTHLMTAGRTRLMIDANGNLYTGNGTSSGAKMHITAGSNFFKSKAGDTIMAALYCEADTTYSPGGYTAGIYSYGGRTGKNGIGAYFEGGRKSSINNSTNYGLVNLTISELTGTNTVNYANFNQASGGAGSFGSYNIAFATRTTQSVYGVYAEANGQSQASSSAYGLYARGTGGTSNNYAAYFSGAVYVNGNLGKAAGSFMIDHPQDPANKYLIHSFVESPEMMNVYNGNIVTDANGIATVALPSYFEAENINFKYQLTVIGQFAQAMVKEKIANNSFVIQTDKPNVEVSWQVTGVRNDKYAQAHPIVVEKAKEPANVGKYLQPELYGLPEYMGIHYVPFKPTFGTTKQ